MKPAVVHQARTRERRAAEKTAVALWKGVSLSIGRFSIFIFSRAPAVPFRYGPIAKVLICAFCQSIERTGLGPVSLFWNAIFYRLPNCRGIFILLDGVGAAAEKGWT